MRRPAAAFLIGAVALASSCARESRPESANPGDELPPAPNVTPPDSQSMADATAALASYLEASREGSSTRDSLPALTACADDGGRSPGPMLAAFQILPATARADTVVGRAVVTTVADQDVDRQHPGYFVARLRVRSDTLEWDVLRTASGGWVVCNGLGFGLDAPDSLTTWRPDGASAAVARALADSIGRR